MSKMHAQKELRFTSEIAVVVGVGDELVETMRLASCLPASEADARRIARIVAGGETPGIADRVVRLTRISLHRERATEDWWRARGCTLIDERQPIERRIADAELVAIARRTLLHRNRVDARSASRTTRDGAS